MVAVELLRDTFVRMPAGSVVEVSSSEAKRLAVLGVAKAVEKKQEAAKKPAAKKKA